MFDAIPSWFGTFFIGDFFTEMLLCPLLEDAYPALLLGTLLTIRPPRALLLGTFLTARRPRPCPRLASASSLVLLGESPLTGDTSWPDLVCITRNQCLVAVEEERAGGRQPASYLHRATRLHRDHDGGQASYSLLLLHLDLAPDWSDAYEIRQGCVAL